MEYQRTLAHNKSLSLNGPEFGSEFRDYNTSADLKTSSIETKTTECKIPDEFGDHCTEKQMIVIKKVLTKSGSSEGLSY